MAIIEWDSTMSVGIEKMDEQHQKLIAMMDELHDAIRQKREAEIIEDTLTNLFNYAQLHFATEEKLFALHRYPEERLHELEHRRFIAKAFEFKEMIESGQPDIDLEMLNFLTSWVLSHIELTDKRYTAYLKERGIS